MTVSSRAPVPSGWFNMSKPPGVSSSQATQRIRRALAETYGVTRKKIKLGHAGTLDPFARGCLPLALQRATKTVSRLVESRKGYALTIQLGLETDSLDVTGQPVRAWHGVLPTRKRVEAALEPFQGRIAQIPPRFSAKKRDGVRGYRLARQNVEFEFQPVMVEIFSIELLRYEGHEVALRVECGKGTYMRSLARDLGLALGTYGHLKELCRYRLGFFEIQDALELAQLEQAIREGQTLSLLQQLPPSSGDSDRGA